MNANAEVEALARLGFEELGAAMAGIGNIHKAIADRAFGATGPGATPARVVHDAAARRVYGGLRLGARAAGGAAGRAAAGLRATPLSSTPGGALALGVLNGFIGDQLEREASALAVPMTLRVDGEPRER